MTAPEGGRARGSPELAHIPIRATVAEAWGLLRSRPRALLLPLIVVQVPVALVSSLVVATLLLTTFREQPFQVLGSVSDATDRGLIFLLVAVAAAQLLFAQVARCATIVAVAAEVAGRPATLTGSLDPAFTRMGAVLAQTIALIVMGAAFVASVVLLPLAPFFLARCGVSTEMMILEGQGPIAAIRSSWQLMRGRVIRFVATLLLSGLVLLGPLLILSLLNPGIAGGRTALVWEYAAVSFAQAILAIPITGFLTAVTTLYYLRAKELTNVRRST